MDGINQFFANPTVQEQAGQIFSQRDPVVWQSAGGFSSYHIPAPFGKDDRIVTTVRGTLKSLDEACRLHNTAIVKTLGKARKAGNLSHEAAPPHGGSRLSGGHGVLRPGCVDERRRHDGLL